MDYFKFKKQISYYQNGLIKSYNNLNVKKILKFTKFNRE